MIVLNHEERKGVIFIYKTGKTKDNERKQLTTRTYGIYETPAYKSN